jgi:dTDP-4-amino-4,6-dideoxygalactose transaminase
MNLSSASLERSVSDVSLSGQDSPTLTRSRWPLFEADEIEAATYVLQTGAVNSLHHGAQCSAFERGMAELCEVPYAIAVANGTLALELALRALNIGPGDEVIVPARSFMASASCVVACGASPVFADVDADSQNITANSIEAVITSRTRAAIVVHLAGWPCEMADIMDLARRRGLAVIEDCAQAHGARIDGRPVGSFGDASAFSFCTDKIISTGGEGGMLVMNDRDVWRRAWAYKDHGKDPDTYSTIVPGPDFLWLHGSLGSNFRLTEFQAAIGNCQLAKLNDWRQRRQKNAAAFEKQLSDLDAVRIAQPRHDITHARYKYYAFIRPERLKQGWSRRRILEEAASAGIACSAGSCPEMYLEAAFRDYHLRPQKRLPVARQLGETSLMVPIDHTLSPADLEVSGRLIRYIIQEASE